MSNIKDGRGSKFLGCLAMCSERSLGDMSGTSNRSMFRIRHKQNVVDDTDSIGYLRVLKEEYKQRKDWDSKRHIHSKEEDKCSIELHQVCNLRMYFLHYNCQYPMSANSFGLYIAEIKLLWESKSLNWR